MVKVEIKPHTLQMTWWPAFLQAVRQTQIITLMANEVRHKREGFAGSLSKKISMMKKCRKFLSVH
jgi:hypothetical protein